MTDDAETRWLPAQTAASNAGLSRGHLAHLCREGKVVGKLVDNQWLVDEDSLQRFMLAQDAIKAAHAERTREERRAEYQQHQTLAAASAARKPRTRARRASVTAAIAVLVIASAVALPYLSRAAFLPAPLHDAALSSPVLAASGSIGGPVNAILRFFRGPPLPSSAPTTAGPSPTTPSSAPVAPATSTPRLHIEGTAIPRPDFSEGTLSFNVPITARTLRVSRLLTASGGIATNGANLNLGGGRLLGTNLVSRIHAGANVAITGTASEPTISVTDGAGGAAGSGAIRAIVPGYVGLTSGGIAQLFVNVGGGSSAGISAVTAGAGLTGGTTGHSSVLALDLGASNTWTALQSFSGGISAPGLLSTSLNAVNASTTVLSVLGTAYFGSTATSTFGVDGSLTLAQALGIASGGTGTTTWQTGSIPFFNGTRLTEDNSNLFWDNTNGYLGIGSSTPSNKLSVGGVLSLGSSATTTSVLGSIAWDGSNLYAKGGTATTSTRGWYNLGEGNVIDVFLIAGQSNAVGYGTITSDSPTPTPGTAYKFVDGKIQAESDPTGSSGGASAWPAFAVTYYNLTGHKIAFVPTAVGATAQVAAADTGGGNWDTTGTLYANSIDKTADAMAAFRGAGFTPVFKGILWDQGESDATAIDAATITVDQYKAQFLTMIANYRNAYGTSIPFYIFRIGSAIGSDSSGRKAVRTAQEEVAVQNIFNHMVFRDAVEFASSENASVYMKGDGSTHYSQIGYNRMGVVGAQNVVSGQSDWLVSQFGKLGIGTTLPQRMLHITDNGSLRAQILIDDSNAAANSHYWGLQSADGAFKISSFTDALAGTTRFTIKGSTGNVGIGTTTPAHTLDVNGDLNAIYGVNGGYSSVNGTTAFGSTVWSLDTTFHGAAAGNSYSPTTLFGLSWLRTTNANVLSSVGEGLYGYDNGTLNFAFGTTGGYFVGNVGIASTSPWKTFSVNGTVALAGLTTDTADAKTLCLTAANEVVANTGSTCITSSARFKTDIQPLDERSGLAEVLKLSPVSFAYKPEIGVPGQQVGFIAEDMQAIDSRLVVLDASSTPFTVRYENLTAILAKAIQEIATLSGTFKDNLVAWLADAGNGIHDLYADTLHAKNRLCVDDVCVTRDQFLRMVQQSGQAAGQGSGTSGAPATPAPSEPPAPEASNEPEESEGDQTQTPPAEQVASPKPSAPAPEASNEPDESSDPDAPIETTPATAGAAISDALSEAPADQSAE
jgi:hypothetical protein